MAMATCVISGLFIPAVGCEIGKQSAAIYSRVMYGYQVSQLNNVYHHETLLVLLMCCSAIQRHESNERPLNGSFFFGCCIVASLFCLLAPPQASRSIRTLGSVTRTRYPHISSANPNSVSLYSKHGSTVGITPCCRPFRTSTSNPMARCPRIK
ncbi:hypothetical protein BC827DRAFT_875056 [Russula dissimulans]|nr:hypothetical protein BC827DRAFT_875056 [Russula dissimulans]